MLIVLVLSVSVVSAYVTVRRQILNVGPHGPIFYGPLRGDGPTK